MLKRRMILMILFCIWILSSVSFVSLLVYFDPYIHLGLSLPLIILIFIFGVSSFFSLILYFFKKIYYRGEVGVYHIMTSLRQSIFIALFFTGCVTFIAFEIPYILPSLLLLCVFVFLELFIENI